MMPYTIRPTRPDDCAALSAIENAAEQLFVDYGMARYPVGDPVSVDEHRAYVAAGRSWVAVDAGDQPVGFAIASLVDGHAHLEEIDVHPDHGRRGIGRALVEGVCDWAREAGLFPVTLTTERDIPWNAPFYARLGFAIMADSDLTDELRAILAREGAWGLDPATRVVMVRAV